LPTVENARRTTPVLRLERHLAQCAESVPFLVVRNPALERTAWREGLRAARKLERRAADAFATAADRVLRAGDRIAHDEGSDVFIAALTAPTRDGAFAPAPIDARSSLARICATMEAATKLEADTGWTIYNPLDDGEMAPIIELVNSLIAKQYEKNIVIKGTLSGESLEKALKK